MIEEQKSDPPSPPAEEPASEREYKIGPGRPPLETRFKKGAASPNPKGRPRKNATLQPDLKKALEDALNEKVSVKKGDSDIRLSKATLGIEQLVTQFAKGDRYARRDIMDMAAKLGVDLLAGQRSKLEEVISPDHQVLLAAYVARQPRPANPPPPEPVIAPPELRDDDPTYRERTKGPVYRPVGTNNSKLIGPSADILKVGK
jgi:hypothetical protein